ncbi:MAG TPA: VWA domain-containing protein [Pseudomonadales bacterium]|jgi:Ca-activated chloride channel family protein|nr:VWA domain-containing protein [Pseudomonadales bacterium]HNI37481.1 VWA domain-containing protein [Pseudomonadales bacterium]HNL91477.1 VWA domain-containing protein [Pseudomonadales bacterium]
MQLDFLPLTDFHWLRPLWLLAIFPALLFFIFLLRKTKNDQQWLGIIDQDLLPALLEPSSTHKQSKSMYALLCAWVLSILAIAGPSFEKVEQPVIKSADALVIMLDLSPSMLATDTKPSRIQAAHFKLLDLLRERHEGYTALVVYSGSAHVVTPLSDDTNTIAALVNTLDPYIMPKAGSRTEDAVALSIQLLRNANIKRGRLLLMTDGVAEAALNNINTQLRGTDITLNIIGIGTAEGAPIPLPRGGFATDNQGNILMNPLDSETLKKLAHNHGGYYSDLRADDADITPLTTPPAELTTDNNRRENQRNIENWLDSGYWLVLPCLFIALFFFRRGVVVCVLPLMLFFYQQNVHAELPAHWQDWWQTADQQAAQALKNGDTKTAAQKFSNPQWKAYAEYQNGQHKEAIQGFSSSSDAASLYNKGNAQAKSNDLQGAIDSYNEALKIDPNLKDAEFNRDIVKKLLEQQKKQNENNQQQDKNDQKKEQDQQNQKNNSESKDSKDSDKNQGQQQDEQQDQKNSNEQSKQQDQQQDKQRDQKNSNEQSKQQDQQQQKQQENPQPENKSSENQQSSNKDSKSPQEQKEEKNQEQAAAEENKDSKDNEKQQAVKQMLNVVPDDPGGLLRNKFEYYYQRNQQQGRSTDDNGEERW